MKMSDHERIPNRQRIFLVTQGIFQFLLAVFITSTVWLMAHNRDWETLHTWHVFLSTVGVSFIMAQAVSILNPGNVFVLGCTRLSRGFLHGIVMTFATIALVAGVSIKIQDKINNNRSHFTSTHGILGVTTYILTMLSFIGGLFVAFGKLLYKLFDMKPTILKNCHIFFGMAAYAIGTATLCFGLRYYFSEASYYTNTAFIVILAIYACLNLLGPLRTLFRL